MLDIKITRTATPKAKPTDETKLGFGKKFSDHMFVMDYTEGEGWHDARIVPYGPFELDPATVVFHYAQEIFEGMKAYRTADDTAGLCPAKCCPYCTIELAVCTPLCSQSGATYRVER